MDSPGLAHAIKHAGAQVRIVFDTTKDPCILIVGCQSSRLVDGVSPTRRYYRQVFIVTPDVLRSVRFRAIVIARLTHEVEQIRKYVGVPVWT